MPRVRRLVESGYSTTNVSVYFLLTSSRRSCCDVLSDNSLPVAILSTSQTDCRMEKSHLGYFLRQKVIEVETESQEANDAMIVAVNWLNRLSIHFEEFCQRINPDIHFSTELFNQPVLVYRWLKTVHIWLVICCLKILITEFIVHNFFYYYFALIQKI